MNALQKKLIAAIAVLTAIACTMALCLFHAVMISPDQLTVRYETYKDAAIPSSMDDVTIAYFTDLEYGLFEDEKRAANVFDTLASLSPDILIFGGDLFAKDYAPDEEAQAKMAAWLNQIPAPLGKFAVYGEQDLADETHLNAANAVYGQSGVEVLDNRSVFLANGTNAGIRLAGASIEPDWNGALASCTSDTFNLLVCHYTDILQDEALQISNISQALAGNSHGTQITYPIYGGYKSWEGSEVINRADEPGLAFPYTISAGTGCIEVNARFNAEPEVYYIVLKHR